MDDGSYELEVPFTDVRELVNEVLWHGDQVLIVSPPSLKATYITLIETMLKNSHTSASD